MRLRLLPTKERVIGCPVVHRTKNNHSSIGRSLVDRTFGSRRYAWLSWVASFVLLITAFAFVVSVPSPVASQVRQSVTSQSALLDDGRPAFAPGEVVVKIKARPDDRSAIPVAQVASLVAGRYQLRETSRIDALNVFVYQLPDGADVLSAVGAMSSDSSIEWAEPNYYRYIDTIPDDPYYRLISINGNTFPQSYQRWVFNGRYNDLNLNGESAWSLTSGRSDVVIAVIDSGVLINQPDLTQNIWRNTKETLNGLDDDSNGYIDDVNGWDFRGNTPTGPSQPDNDPNPDFGDGLDNDGSLGADSTAAHGTFVASIAASQGNNGAFIAGACWSCKIMPLKVFTDDGGATTADLVNAITYATRNGASVINMSLGSSTSSLLEDQAVQFAIANGVTVVASAGNDNSSDPHYPASFANVISVGATDWGGDVSVPQSGTFLGLRERAPFSQYGKNALDVVAPGIVAGIKMLTRADENGGKGTTGNTLVQVGAGTSYASPLVAGLAGLMISYARQLDRPITNLEVSQLILDSATKLEDDTTDFPDGGRYWDNFGRVEFLQALKAIDGSGIRTLPLTAIKQTGSIPAPIHGVELGLTQYKVTVTNETQELRVTVNGSSNVELFGEFGRRVKPIQLVYGTYAAPGSFSNKTLIVNKTSNPPLMGGDYYFAIGNKGSNTLNYSIATTAAGETTAIGTNPSSISFGQATVGTALETSLSIQNSGDFYLNVSGVSVNNARFTVSGGPALPFVLGPQNQTAIKVKFSPIAAGVESGTITLTSNDPIQPSLSVPISGEGVCRYSLPTSSSNVEGNGDTSSVLVGAPSACTWAATTTTPWISITSPTPASGTAVVIFTVAPNPDATARTGEIQIADQKLTVNQAAAAPLVTIVNAADYAPDKILAPDGIGAAFGQFKTTGGASYNATSLPLPSTLGGISVTINGRTAGIGFAGPTQVNLVVPTDLSDGPATIIVRNVDGTTSTGTFTIVRSRPGIFSSNSYGSGAPAGQVYNNGVVSAVGNPDGTPREISAGTSEQPTTLVLYLTGLRKAPAQNPNDGNGVAEAVKVTFNGVEVTPDYAGEVQGFVGLDQINVRIPWALSGFGSISVKVLVSNGQGGFRESNLVTIRVGGTLANIVAQPISRPEFTF